MPDIVSNVQTMSLDHSSGSNSSNKNFEDERSAIKIETPNFANDCNENYSQHNNNYQYDPILSKQASTVDMSAIVDPIIINYQLMSMHQSQKINGVDSDSILNDIDMLS